MDFNIDWTSNGSALGKTAFTLYGGTTDTSHSSLVLTGTGVVNYGEIQQENFLHLLEHFASSSPPSNPTVGQLWFNTGDNLLYTCIDASTAGVTPIYFTGIAPGFGWVKSGASSVSIANSNVDPTWWYPSMASATSGTFSQANVSSLGLKFQPSTGRLATSGNIYAGANGTGTLNGTRFIKVDNVDPGDIAQSTYWAAALGSSVQLTAWGTGYTSSIVSGKAGIYNTAANGMVIWDNSTTEGIEIRTGAGGTLAGFFDSTGLSLPQRLFVSAGTATSPSIAFTADGAQDTGFYWSTDGYINFTNNGVYAGQVQPGGILAMVGGVTAPTPIASDNSTKMATTAFVKGAITTAIGAINVGVTSITVSGTAGRITGGGTAITSTGSVALDLATTAVTAGNYTAANISVDAYGRITAAANGTNILGTSSLATNGYQKLGNGLIIQWGHSAAWATVNFPIAFSTIFTAVAVKNSGSGSIGEFGVTYSTTSITPGTNGNVTAWNWLAIGV